MALTTVYYGVLYEMKVDPVPDQGRQYDLWKQTAGKNLSRSQVQHLREANIIYCGIAVRDTQGLTKFKARTGNMNWTDQTDKNYVTTMSRTYEHEKETRFRALEGCTTQYGCSFVQM